jgi:hypothetical protein
MNYLLVKFNLCRDTVCNTFLSEILEANIFVCDLIWGLVNLSG